MEIVTLEEMKQYLRVDFDEDDSLLASFISTASQLCLDVARCENEDAFISCANSKTAVMYATAYLYEHRENADHNKLTLSLRALLFGNRKEAF